MGVYVERRALIQGIPPTLTLCQKILSRRRSAMRFRHLMHVRRRRLRRWMHLTMLAAYPTSEGADEREERLQPSDNQKPRRGQFDAVLPFWRFREMYDRAAAGRADYGYAGDLEHEDLEDDEEDLNAEDLED